MGRTATVTKEDVLNTQRDLAVAGRNCGAVAIRAALGRGSFSTITKLLEEGADSDPASEASVEAQQSIKLFWKAAYESGRLQSEAELKQHQKQASEMALALDTLTGEKDQLSALIEEARRDLSSAHMANAKLLETSLLLDERTNKAAALSESKDRQIEDLRAALDQAIASAHRLELENARLEGQMAILGTMPANLQGKNSSSKSERKSREEKKPKSDNKEAPTQP